MQISDKFCFFAGRFACEWIPSVSVYTCSTCKCVTIRPVPYFRPPFRLSLSVSPSLTLSVTFSLSIYLLTLYLCFSATLILSLSIFLLPSLFFSLFLKIKVGGIYVYRDD